jgi:DNA-binding XRE family transcriptional regulator
MVGSARLPEPDLAELAAVVEMRHLVANGRAAEIRRLAGATQADVARAVGCSPAAISLWESARRVPSSKLGRRYARALAQLAKGAGL